MVSKEMADELHKQYKKVRQFRKVVSGSKDNIWSMDLVFMFDKDKKIVKANKGYKYILTVIDLFTRYGWAVPLKSKDAENVWDAFEKIISQSKRQPKHIWVDEGGEFYNKIWEEKLHELGADLYSTANGKKAVVVERFNKTLKDWMWQDFTVEEHNKWVDRLPDLISKYNDKVHSALKMSPTEASELSNKQEKKLTKLEYAKSVGPVGKPKFQLEDWVRVLRTKERFEKGYTTRWSKQIYQIVRIDLNTPITYYIQDENGEMEKGLYYENELQKTKQQPETTRSPLTNEIPVDDWRYVKTKSKKKFDDIEVHTLDPEDNEWAWRPILKYLVPVKGDKGKFNVVSIARFIHHELFNEVWRKI